MLSLKSHQIKFCEDVLSNLSFDLTSSHRHQDEQLNYKIGVNACLSVFLSDCVCLSVLSVQQICCIRKPSVRISSGSSLQ